MLSLAGFAAKYYIFYVALQSGHPELLIIAAMFMEKEPAAQSADVVTTTSPTPTPIPGRCINSGKLSKEKTPVTVEKVVEQPVIKGWTT